MSGPAVPLAGAEPLIDIHAHFLHAGCGRSDWERVNTSRFSAGERIGITYHVASILGSFGHTSPTYFASPTDVATGNDEMHSIAQREASRVRWYVHVNPNEGANAIAEIERGVKRGAVGLKLSASRRADHQLVDDLMESARKHHLPVLHHIWQHRTRHWPSQDISDGADLARLAERHPDVAFILAHIGGGGDYAHTFPAVADFPNIYLDLSGSGVDRGMLDDALAVVGARRLVWGADITLETGLAKLWALEVIGLSGAEMSAVRWENAGRIFPAGSFPKVERGAPPA